MLKTEIMVLLLLSLAMGATNTTCATPTQINTLGGMLDGIDKRVDVIDQKIDQSNAETVRLQEQLNYTSTEWYRFNDDLNDMKGEINFRLMEIKLEIFAMFGAGIGFFFLIQKMHQAVMWIKGNRVKGVQLHGSDDNK